MNAVTAQAVDTRAGREVAEGDWRTSNAGHLLFASTDLFVRDKLQALHEGGVSDVSEALMALLLNLDRNGTRLTTLAERASQTKQSMIELVDRAEAMGLVERRPDLLDLRARPIWFTPAGLSALFMLEDGIRRAERRFGQVVGVGFLVELKSGLGRYLGLSDAEDAAPAAEWREHNAGRLLALSARRFGGEVVRFVQARGYPEVTPFLLALFRNLEGGGTRLTELARRARMTKQSMRELIDRAEALGFVERGLDPSDGRAKIIVFTPSGLHLLNEMRRGVVLVEDEFGMIAGDTFVVALKTRLARYLDASDEG